MDPCIYDRFDECFHDCEGCPSYRHPVCKDCGEPVTAEEYERYNGLCWDCELGKLKETQDVRDDYLHDNDKDFVKYLVEKYKEG
jgi:hypothetical protein